MHLCRRNMTSVFTLHGTPLEVVPEYCDLGVTIDKALPFYQHVEKIVKKANTVSYLVHHAFLHCNIDNALMLYKSYLRPMLVFNTVSWNDTCEK